MSVGVSGLGLALPTGVGVNRDAVVCFGAAWCAPHRRGGEPKRQNEQNLIDQRSPQAWG